MEFSEFELGWLIGLIEADGSFTFSGKGGPVVAVKMTDRDTVQRFADLMQVTVNGPYLYKDSQLGTKPWFVAKIRGKRAINFMASTRYQFSARRQVQIQTLLGKQSALALERV